MIDIIFALEEKMEGLTGWSVVYVRGHLETKNNYYNALCCNSDRVEWVDVGCRTEYMRHVRYFVDLLKSSENVE